MSIKPLNSGWKTAWRLMLATAILLAAAPICRAAQADAVDQAFLSFSNTWLATLQASYLYPREKPQILEEGHEVVARFFYLDPGSVRTKVKADPRNAGVYTGVLRYRECLYESRGSTRQKALDGFFTLVSQKDMIEIFLYQDGRWNH